MSAALESLLNQTRREQCRVGDLADAAWDAAHYRSMRASPYDWKFEARQAASRMAQEEAMRAGELRGLPTVFGALEAA